MNEVFERTISLIGDASFKKINHSCVAVFGLGGVGSYVVEGLVRAGIGKLVIVDFAKVTVSNINRQIIASRETVGQPKTEVTEKRAKSINDKIVIVKHMVYVNQDNIEKLLENESVDYIVDAIDSVQSKIAIIKYAKANDIPLISSMGTGNKLNPSMFLIDDISKSSVCPLARRVRKILKEEKITKVDVLYSKELPIKEYNEQKVPASISFVPSVAGLLISGHVINKIIKNVI